MYAKYKFNYLFLLNLHSKIIIIKQQVGGMKIFLPIQMLKWVVGIKRLSTPVLEYNLKI